MFLTTTNGQQKSIAATNNRTVPLITDAFLLCVTKIHEGLDGGGGVLHSLFIKNLANYSSH